MIFETDEALLKACEELVEKVHPVIEKGSTAPSGSPYVTKGFVGFTPQDARGLFYQEFKDTAQQNKGTLYWRELPTISFKPPQTYYSVWARYIIAKG